MYVPHSFRETRRDVLQALITAHPFATLITTVDGLPQVDHLPMLLCADAPVGPETLRCHVARANPVWQTLEPGAQALAVFQGPAAYVSPSWYRGKARDPRVVPTWNYVVVHARGTVRVVQEPDWLYRLITDLTGIHEAASREPWRVTDAPTAFVDTLVGQIVGIELTIAELTGKWKLSQNRPAEDVAGVIQGLRARNRGADVALADLMEHHRP